MIHEPIHPSVSGDRAVDKSIDAAREMKIAVGHLQRVALKAIRAAGGRGLTTNELVAAVRITRDAIQPRTSELRDRGLIRDSGARRRNETGIKAIVWVATISRGSNGR